MDIHRSLIKWAIQAPLFPNHMSFILGPRQVGKTTLAKTWLKKCGTHKKNYLNFDAMATRSNLKKKDYSLDEYVSKKRSVLVIDEIHKIRGWKRILKGMFDTHKEEFSFIVTGSGRLDAFQKGGDSLAGRYDPYYLFPLTPGEIERTPPADLLTIEDILNAKPIKNSTFQSWLMLGGFPEPFFTGSAAKATRWFSQYTIRVTEEDMRDLTNLQSVDLMRDCLRFLPQRVGSPLSINSMREDLEVSFDTAKRYLLNLEQLFFTFSLNAYSKKIHRAVKKEKKTYFYYHPAVQDAGYRFENALAIACKKWTRSATERGLGEYEIQYLRDQDRREIDFLITKDEKPHLLIEAKLSDTTVSTAGIYYAKKLGIPFIQVVAKEGVKRKLSDINGAIVSAHSILRLLG